ncbi:ABC transporter substrate-binding protein [Ancylobacter sp. Lp-2]|uniref:ABC transporter substrate-binding protein n=1 Tax=Ancylobacter sp. Lp-2 TaxID=2881339 RepID=UPI001E3DCA0B|nr:ABC transporter substrate-binding protein [Ancylobacter sp. Lp-2]MCB4770102.1 ABC transporter substrate-binding protein [Ancylobacter sp. Lp-2]
MKPLMQAALIGAAAWLGASAAHADPIVIEVEHFMPAHNVFHEQVAAAFMKAHPDIVIKFRNALPSYDEQHQALLREAITNNLPDVYHSGYHLLPEVVHQLQKRGQVITLDGYIAKEGEGWVSTNYEPSILNLGKVDGKQYGIGFNASTPIVFYNADLVKQAGSDPEHFPTNWADMVALGARIKALGGDVDGMAYDIHAWPDDWLWRSLILQQGEAVMKDDNKTVAFDNGSGLTALKLARSIVTDGKMVPRDYEQSRQQFAAGKLGIIFASPNSARGFSDLIGTRFKLMSSTYPVSNLDKGVVPTGGNAMMILSKDKAKQDAAWEYIKFATSAEGQTIAVLGSGYMPTNKAALAPEYLGKFYDENPNWYTSIKQISRAAPWGGYPGTNGVKIWRTQRDIIGQVMRGDITPEDGVAKLTSETNALLPK